VFDESLPFPIPGKLPIRSQYHLLHCLKGIPRRTQGFFFIPFNPTLIALMWFEENGHFAKNEETESEVSHECSKNQTKLHQRIQI
jgi:hypothetical protein